MGSVDESFDQFLAEELPALLRLAGALTGDRALAEEIVQDTLLKATSRWPQIAATRIPRPLPIDARRRLRSWMIRSEPLMDTRS